MKRSSLWAGALALALSLACVPAKAQNQWPTPGGARANGMVGMCLNGTGKAVPWSSGTCAGALPVTGSFSATISGFLPSAAGARATPLSVGVSDSSGSLPTGAVVDVSNVGSNPIFCNVNNVAATTADKLIAPNSWFEFTVPAGVNTLHCIATGGTSTANMVGGSGLGTGAGGGTTAGGGGSGLSVQDSANWTANSSPFTPSGGEYNPGAAPLTAGQQGTFALSADRHQLVLDDNSLAIALNTGFPLMTGTAPGTAPSKTVITGGKYNTTPPTASDGQSMPLQQDSNGRVIVNCGAGCLPATSGTSAADTAAFPAGTLQTAVGGVFNDGLAPLGSGTQGAVRLTAARSMHVLDDNTSAIATSVAAWLMTGTSTGTAPARTGIVGGKYNATPPTASDGQTLPLQTDANGRLIVNCGTGCGAGGGGGGTSQTDATAFAYGGGVFTPIGGEFHTTITPLTSGNAGAAAMTAQRSLHVLDDNSASMVSAVQGPVPNPNSASAWGLLAQGSTTASQLGQLALGAVTTVPPAYTTGQSSPFSLDTAGNMRVACISGCSSSGGSSQADATAFAQGPSSGSSATVAMALYTTSVTNLSSGQAGALRATIDRKLMVDTPNIEQTGSTAATNSVQIAGVYNSSPPTLTTGQGAPLLLTAAGAARTQVDNVNANVGDNADAVVASATFGSPVVNHNALFNGSTWDRQKTGTITGAALTQLGSQYPSAATAITATANGTTTASAATLAGTAGKITFLCGFSIRANATAATSGLATVTGLTGGTANYAQWVAPLASGMGTVEMVFMPCVPASAANTAIAITTATPGSGGLWSTNAWGYQL